MRKSLEQINTQILNVDRTYQRPLKNTYKRIAAQFDPLLVGVITLSRRADGTIWILDGQHRVAAAKEKNIETLDALIYEGLTIEQEAYIFSMQNHNRIKVNPFDLYNAGKLSRGTLYHTLSRIAQQVGTPIVKITETGPRTIGVYIQKLNQFGEERTKQVFLVNKNCNKRLHNDLYNERIQRAIYSRLATETVKQVTERINQITNLRTVISQSYAETNSDYGNLI